MILKTTKFGEIEIEENRIFDFKIPIIGFNELKDFVILDFKQESFFKWLQSVEDPELAFPIVSIFNMNIDYSVDLPDKVIDKLEIEKVEDLLVMNIASIPQDNPEGTTINLLAPLIFNVEKNVAGQVILSGSGYDISFPLFKQDGQVQKC